MKRKESHTGTKVLAGIVIFLLFGLASPVIAEDYVWISSGTHDIDYSIGGALDVSNATVNLLTGSHIVALYGDGFLTALENSIINIYGGTIDGGAFIVSTATVTVFGSDFVLDGTPVEPNVTEIYNPGPSYADYVLTGTYNDESSFTLNVNLDPDARIYLDQAEPETHPEIVVYPTDLLYDFGDVNVGDSSTYVVQIQNVGNGELEVNSVTLEGSADFAITAAPSTPFTIAPSEAILVDIEITYTPSAAGAVSTTLAIESDDEDESLVEVALGGVGVVVEVPPTQQIQNIIDSYSQSINLGTIVGYGPGNSPEKRVKALLNMLKAASDLIIAEDYAQAIAQLEAIDKKSDGAIRPPDFIVGDDVASFNLMVNDLIDDLSS
jgi:hypothetical protein